MALDLNYGVNQVPYTLGLNGLTQGFTPRITFGSLDTTREAFTFAPESTSFDLGDSLTLDAAVIDKVLTPYSMSPASTPTGALNNLSSTFADYLGGLKAQGQKQQAMGATLRTVSSAVKVFDDLLTWDLRRESINLQKSNAKQAADNEMLAIDNQTMYAKNQLMDRFNSIVANNTVTMAARNLKVSTANILEASKETAHDIDMDFRTLESNADLKKANLKNQKKQADIAAKFAKTKQWTDFIGHASELGLNVATGGMTGQSWGSLYSAFQSY